MIRDKNKIYGEPNDPNTVLASGTLKENSLVVGAGNKGVKSLENTGKALVWVKDGKVQLLPIHLANSVLGTDENGNLVWRLI